MKTRNSNTTEIVKQGGGCCGSTPVQVQPAKSFCCDSTPEVEVVSQTASGCC